MIGRVWLLALTFAIAGCFEDPTDSRWSRSEQLAQIAQDYPGNPAVQIPATASVGVPIRVVVNTETDGCGVMGRTTVSVNGLHAVIMPFDTFVVPPVNGACPDILWRWEHSADVRFDTRGAATVTVLGRRWRTADTVRLEYPLIVQ